MGRSLRDILVLLMVLWIPTSVLLFVRHSTQTNAELRRELIDALRSERNPANAGAAPITTVPLVETGPGVGLRGGAGPQPPEIQINNGISLGWPVNPAYAATGRAVEAKQLPSNIQTADWITQCNALIDANKALLNTGKASILCKMWPKLSSLT